MAEFPVFRQKFALRTRGRWKAASKRQAAWDSAVCHQKKLAIGEPSTDSDSDELPQCGHMTSYGELCGILSAG